MKIVNQKNLEVEVNQKCPFAIASEVLLSSEPYLGGGQYDIATKEHICRIGEGPCFGRRVTGKSHEEVNRPCSLNYAQRGCRTYQDNARIIP